MIYYGYLLSLGGGVQRVVNDFQHPEHRKGLVATHFSSLYPCRKVLGVLSYDELLPIERMLGRALCGDEMEHLALHGCLPDRIEQ